jgi:hypothetical protein
MTCVELHASLVENEDGSSIEQQAHLRNCPECAKMVGDLLVIACSAGELRAAHEPHPRVWKSIESTLRREGIIRPQRRSPSLLPSLSSQWSWARWMAPAAALLLITLGIYLKQASRLRPTETGTSDTAVSVTPGVENVPDGLDDADLLQEAAQQSPALQERYADNLRRVNQYIQDAKNVVAADPNDEEARRSLMEAYQEKAMLFELALDRSLQ